MPAWLKERTRLQILSEGSVSRLEFWILQVITIFEEYKTEEEWTDRDYCSYNDSRNTSKILSWLSESQLYVGLRSVITYIEEVDDRGKGQGEIEFDQESDEEIEYQFVSCPLVYYLYSVIYLILNTYLWLNGAKALRIKRSEIRIKFIIR